MVKGTIAQLDHDEKQLINHQSNLDRNPWWAQTMIYMILFILSIITLLPLVNVLSISLSEADAIYRNPMMLVPRQFTIEAYQYIFSTRILLTSFGVSVFATVMGTLLNLMFTITGGYALSKTQIPAYKYWMWFIIFPMLFSAGLIPMYILLKNLHLIDSIWVLVFTGLVAPFYLILMRNFFWSIPEELEESARMEGASDLRILLHVVIPLSKPAIATIGLFYAVGHWNDLFTGLFFINDNTKWPLQVLLRSIIIDMNALNTRSLGALTNEAGRIIVAGENIKAATIIFSIVPILMVYPFLQKYFVKGILLGSVKG